VLVGRREDERHHHVDREEAQSFLILGGALPYSAATYLPTYYRTATVLLQATPARDERQTRTVKPPYPVKKENPTCRPTSTRRSRTWRMEQS
jgi:hypothetical protein